MFALWQNQQIHSLTPECRARIASEKIHRSRVGKVIGRENSSNTTWNILRQIVAATVSFHWTDIAYSSRRWRFEVPIYLVCRNLNRIYVKLNVSCKFNEYYRSYRDDNVIELWKIQLYSKIDSGFLVVQLSCDIFMFVNWEPQEKKWVRKNMIFVMNYQTCLGFVFLSLLSNHYK